MSNLLDLRELTERARYSDELQVLAERLKVKEILKLDYDSGWQGQVDVTALLEDGRVWSYIYFYGSCSHCDEWEGLGLDEEGIIRAMEKESTFFNNKTDWDSAQALKNE